MRKRSIILFALLLTLAACKEKPEVVANYEVIPMPKEIVPKSDEVFELTGKTKIYYPVQNEDVRRNAEFLSQYIADITSYKLECLPLQGDEKEGIFLSVNPDYLTEPESYEIAVNPQQVTISGADAAGIFYGIQTLRKSLPTGVIQAMEEKARRDCKIVLPCATVSDYPRFHYRGMHLDVCRHFMPLDSVKIYIDMLAMHGMNRFHFHISEDQGWRMEIKKYPKLTEIGAYRKNTVIGHNSGAYDTIPHGGFYTQDEMHDLVQYAADRYITIIPEIDLPGHMQAALASYPELGCTGGPYEVWNMWGVSEDVLCAGREETMLFLEDVLNEVMDVFPSDIIHIGGDECPKVRWHECPRCQAKIKELGLKAQGKYSAEDFLQSYVMSRMEKVIEARGRRIIGWDEILEGEVAKNAIVMSWRGIDGGIDAARLGHDVIMTPNTYLYFDYNQTEDVSKEPVVVTGYLPVEIVYGFEPVPSELTPEEQKHIIGVQANIWTEHIPYFRYVQYNAMPRMAALAEIQWCQPEQKDYDAFVNRCFRLADLYDLYDFCYAKHIFDLKVKTESDLDNGRIVTTLSKYGEGEIRYTLDGSDPVEGLPYEKPISINENCTLRAVVIRPTGEGNPYETEFNFSKATMKPVTLTEAPDKNYTYGGAPILNDGLKGSYNFRSGRWLGFWGRPLEATFDLLEASEVSRVRFNADVDKGSWIFNPKAASVWVSDDGVQYTRTAAAEYPIQTGYDADKVQTYELTFDPVEAHYVRVKIEPYDLPESHPGYGYPAWIFVDEIEVD